MAGFMSGIVPPKGTYVASTFYYFNGTAGSEVRNGVAELGVGVHMSADFLQATYVSDMTLLGGTYAASGAIAVAGAGLHAHIDTPVGVADLQAGNSGFGDSILTPILLGWHDGNLHWNAGFSFYVPTGGYAPGQFNMGRNIWGFMPAFAITWFDPASGWDFSSSFTYVGMTNNDATDYQSGDILHMDWAAGRHFGEGGAWEIGLAGNVVQQIGADRGSGARLGPFKAESVGIGPALSYSAKAGDIPLIFGTRWEHDIDHHDTFGGDVLDVSVTAAF
jgi:hypothetical protein